MKMLCRMCLLESENTLCIFEHDPGQFQIAPTIGRHFWFEPSKDDPISIMICMTCWSKISDFHTYYLSIEGAQRLLTEFSSVKEETEIASVEHLKNEYVDEYLDKKDDNIAKDTTKSTTTSQTGASDDNCPVFVDVDHGESDNDSGDPMRESFDGDYRDDGHDSSICSSDEEPLAKKVVRTRVQSIKKEPKKRRSGRTKNNKNICKTLDVVTSDTKAKKGRVQPKSNQVILTDNDTSIQAGEQTDVQMKLELKESSSFDSSEETDNLQPKGRDSKKKSGKIETIKRVKKSPNLEHQKKNKMYDDAISQFLSLQCELCSTPCQKFADVKGHFRTMHNKRGYVVCCTKKFYQRVYLYEHIQKHKNPETFKCKFCDKVYCSGQVLRSHLRTHDASFKKRYQCDICERRFINLSILNNHKILHMPKEEHAFACDVCGKTFPSKNLMNSHKRAIHERAYTQICHICAKVIVGKTLFTLHQQEHAGIVDAKVQCEQCGMWLKNTHRLKIHTKKLHDKDNSVEHICHICQKVTPSRSALTGHIRYAHAGKPRFSCNICGKAFKIALNLKEHMTTHTGDVLYTCPHCPKTFNSNANRHAHRKKMHREEWEESRRSRGLPVNTK